MVLNPYLQLIYAVHLFIMDKEKRDQIIRALILLEELRGNLSETAHRLGMSKATLMRWRDKYEDGIPEVIEKAVKTKVKHDKWERKKREKKEKKEKKPTVIVKEKKPKKEKEIIVSPPVSLDVEIQEYATKKMLHASKVLDERDEWLEVLKMFREKLTPDNILKQDPKKLSDVFKILHEAGTGEKLDDDENKTKNSFYTVINQQILNQNNDE